MPEEKVEVVVDLIQVAVSLDEVERILVALHSEFPLITILNRVSDITGLQAFENRSDDGMTPGYGGHTVESEARHQGRSLL